MLSSPFLTKLRTMKYTDSDQHQKTKQRSDAFKNYGMDMATEGMGCFIQLGIIIGFLIFVGILVAIFS